MKDLKAQEEQERERVKALNDKKTAVLLNAGLDSHAEKKG